MQTGAHYHPLTLTSVEGGEDTCDASYETYRSMSCGNWADSLYCKAE